MNAKDLVGQIALRTKPTELGNGCKDYSFCSGSGVKILAANDDHVIIEGHSGKPWALDNRYIKDWAPMYGAGKGGMQ